MTRKELIVLYDTATSEMGKLPANRGAARARFQKARAMIDATTRATPRGEEPDAANCELIKSELKTAREFAAKPPAAPGKKSGKKKPAPKKSGKKKPAAKKKPRKK